MKYNQSCKLRLFRLGSEMINVAMNGTVCC